ncbi:MAG: Permease of the drug/metabolite transporter (DMT) superfamily [uncultured Gemmatimonadetes bacterium]|uniref:Permease of the drug/metabolite transporter (DMT) superfamily n=1 Tax=uncultured Gemmatimonadota bacterium TaxID=203437 RepID=A0A6J4N0D6_9BACT|nr:MAG: Permease of the drug/metabolite transporter (DMT) superfamily [uncultured Gemmatimonadota bacterium]
MLALWAFARARPVDASPVTAADGGTLWPLAIAAAATVAAYATRSAGLPLVLAAGGWLAWKRRWRDLALLAAVVLPFAVAWWVRARMMGGPGYTSFLWYVDPYRPSLGTVSFGGMLERISRNTGKYAGEHIPNLLIGARDTGLARAAGVAVVGLAAAGWALRVSRAGVAELLLPLYLGLVLVWPAEWAGERFILPVLPVLLLYAAEAVAKGTSRVGAARAAGVAGTAVVLLMALPAQKAAASGGSHCRAEFRRGEPFPCVRPPWQDFFHLAGQARGTLPEGSVVLSRKPTLFWAFSGYPSRTYPFSAEPDTLLAEARRAGAEYVVVDQIDNVAAMYLAPVLIRRSKGFCVVQSMGADRPTLMGILPDAERAADTGSGRQGETVDVAFASCGPAYRRAPDGKRLGPERLLR